MYSLQFFLPTRIGTRECPEVLPGYFLSIQTEIKLATTCIMYWIYEGLLTKA